MSVIDLDKMLQELGPDAPCGGNLEYDPAFVAMELAAQGRPEQQMGDAVVEAQPPDWREVKTRALDLSGRTRDLRVAVYLARALVHGDGLPGLRDGLALVKGLLERYWEPIHPRLDPEDGNDPMLRVNTLASLFDAETTLRSIREAPLVASRALGRFSLRDVEIATGAAPPPVGQEGPLPELSAVDGAFTEVDLEELKGTAAAVAESVELVKGIDTVLTGLVGTGRAADFSPLVAVLKSAQVVLDDRVARRGGTPAGEGAAGAGGAAAAPGEVHTREDVVRALDRICDYYARHEPSSPVPLLLMRAKRLVSKGFMDIMKDLAPSGASEAAHIGGLDRE